MNRFAGTLAACFFALLAAPSAAASDCVMGTCTDVQKNGAVYRICMPQAAAYNGKLIIYAHGFVSPEEPVAIPEDQLVLPDGTSIPALVNALGFGFATTSYPANGLVVIQGIQDLLDLLDHFKTACGPPFPSQVILGGVSEGGLIVTKTLELHPAKFSGALATCGPIGDFRDQINYFGDFRVVFDYFFPRVLPPTAVQIPPDLMGNWDPAYRLAVRNALLANPPAAKELFSVTKVPLGTNPILNGLAAADRLLWYNVFATNNARTVLGGQPFENRFRWYSGSSNDFRLNRMVARFAADPAALASIQSGYQTTGRISKPLVTLHNLEDPIVPYWHESQYWLRAFLAGGLGQLVQLPSFKYGHCNFSQAEVTFALGVLLSKTGAMSLSSMEQALTSGAAREEYRELVRRHGSR